MEYVKWEMYYGRWIMLNRLEHKVQLQILRN